jgi:hypothetical protein
MSATLRRIHTDIMNTRDLTFEYASVDIRGVADAQLAVQVVSLRDWFPAPHVVSADFVGLRTAMRSVSMRGWTRVRLGDPRHPTEGVPFPPDDPELWGKPALVAPMLHATPPWLHATPWAVESPAHRNNPYEALGP